MAGYSLLLAVSLLFAAVPLLLSDDRPEETVIAALACFTGNYDGHCGESQRLKLQGFLNVTHEETDAFCGGACLEETYQVLDCVDSVLEGFKFYNGAGVGDVKRALRRGCGHGLYRGDFNVDEIMRGDYLGQYDEASRLAISGMISTCVLIFWVS